MVPYQVSLPGSPFRLPTPWHPSMQVPFQARQRFALGCQSQATFPEQSSTGQLHRPSIRLAFPDQHRLVVTQYPHTHPSDLPAVELPCFLLFIGLSRHRRNLPDVLEKGAPCPLVQKRFSSRCPIVPCLGFHLLDLTFVDAISTAPYASSHSIRTCQCNLSHTPPIPKISLYMHVGLLKRPFCCD